MTQDQSSDFDPRTSEDLILRPLQFRSMVARNRVFRDSREPSSDWEQRFARAGVGTIITARAEGPDLSREHIERIHAYLCKYVVRIGRVGWPHLVPTVTEIGHVIRSLSRAARQAREIGADGVEIDGSRGTIIAQFMGQGPSDRPGAYQGPMEHRCRLAREIVRAVRTAVGPDFHVQIRLVATSPLGMMASGVLHLVRWLEEDGIDAVHLTPDGDAPEAAAERSTEIAARFVKEIASVPVLLNGSFRSSEAILAALRKTSCDAVTLMRPASPPHRTVAVRPRLIA